MAFSFKAASFDPNAPADYKLDSISDDPENPITLQVRHAGHGNPGYVNAALKSGQALAQRFPSLTTTAIEQAAERDSDIELLADHVVVGWMNVFEDGAPCPCTPSSVRRFLAELAKPPPDGRPDVVDRLRAWVKNPENFRGAQRAAAALGKP